VLFFLPTNLPESSLVVVSTQDSDSARIEELKTRNYHNIHIEPLPRIYRQELAMVSFSGIKSKRYSIYLLSFYVSVLFCSYNVF